MVTMSTPRRPYVTVCGPLAAGKTTITKLLADHFGWALLLEDLDANPYMRDYYQDMHRWGFHAVMAFLVRALALQDQISTRLAREAVCQDWHFAEHYAIYGVHVFEEGIINERERKTCEELHRYLMAHAVTPDLVITLTARAYYTSCARYEPSKARRARDSTGVHRAFGGPIQSVDGHA